VKNGAGLLKKENQCAADISVERSALRRAIELANRQFPSLDEAVRNLREREKLVVAGKSQAGLKEVGG